MKDPTGKFRIILPPQKLGEIKNISSRVFSSRVWVSERLNIRYTRCPDRAPWAPKTLRHDVNKNLDQLILCIARVVSQSFLGEELANDPEWLKIAMRVSSSALVAASEISA
ncbi:hypothetical protein MMC22_008783 [Lobaria immixta]|nr:hypothetical protein [Lobaria immixta]